MEHMVECLSVNVGSAVGLGSSEVWDESSNISHNLGHISWLDVSECLFGILNEFLNISNAFGWVSNFESSGWLAVGDGLFNIGDESFSIGDSFSDVLGLDISIDGFGIRNNFHDIGHAGGWVCDSIFNLDWSPVDAWQAVGLGGSDITNEELNISHDLRDVSGLDISVGLLSILDELLNICDALGGVLDLGGGWSGEEGGDS